MGLCKCPKRKVTNLFCFEHRVNVCEHCLVANHTKCIVQSYLNWLQDSDYDPVCFLCRENLTSDELSDCVRLLCYDVFHWRCLNSHALSLPANIAPAGYTCPKCAEPIFPPTNAASPVAEALRETLRTATWARSGLSLGLSLMNEGPFEGGRGNNGGGRETAETDSSNLSSPTVETINHPHHLSPTGPRPGPHSFASVTQSLLTNGVSLNYSQAEPTSHSTPTGDAEARPSTRTTTSFLQEEIKKQLYSEAGTTSMMNSSSAYTERTVPGARKLNFMTSDRNSTIINGMASGAAAGASSSTAALNQSVDHDENKYQRRPLWQWITPWFSGLTRSKHPPKNLTRRYFMIVIFAIISLVTLILIVSKLGHRMTSTDPMLDPMANPNIRVQQDPLDAMVGAAADNKL